MGENYVNYNNPNYWAGWNNVLGSLGGAVGQWVDAFQVDQNGQPIQPYIPPTPTQNNTALYIGFGIMFLVLLFVIIYLLRKK